MKAQAFSTDKALIESVIVKLTLEGKVVNEKVPQSLDCFYNCTKVIYNIQHDPSQNHYKNSYKISCPILSESSPSIGNSLKTAVSESYLSNSQVPENKINIENPSDNSAFEKTLNIFIQISAPLNVNPKVMKCYTFQKLPSLRLNLMLSKAM